MGETGFLEDLLRLKEQDRTGWVRAGIDAPESVADHSWGTAILCFRYAERYGVDRGDAVAMGLLHDIAEAETGDLRSEKHGADLADAEKERMEREAVERFVDDAEMAAAWREYADGKTETARFVEDMGQLDMCLTALRYARNRDGGELDGFFSHAAERLNFAKSRELLADIRAEYEAVRDG